MKFNSRAYLGIQYHCKRIFNSVDLRGDFGSIVSLSPEEQTHVAVLWMVDHGEFREACSHLPQIEINDEMEGLPWSAAMVLLAAQGYEKPVFNILRASKIQKKISK